jgi:hypothetical protein
MAFGESSIIAVCLFDNKRGLGIYSGEGSKPLILSFERGKLAVRGRDNIGRRQTDTEV